eukprot:980282_1
MHGLLGGKRSMCLVRDIQKSNLKEVTASCPLMKAKGMRVFQDLNTERGIRYISTTSGYVKCDSGDTQKINQLEVLNSIIPRNRPRSSKSTIRPRDTLTLDPSARATYALVTDERKRFALIVDHCRKAREKDRTNNVTMKKSSSSSSGTMNNDNSLTSPNQLPVHQRSPSTRTQQDFCQQKKSSIGNYRSKSALQSKSLPHHPGNISVTKLSTSPLRSTKIRGIESRMANRQHRIKHAIVEKLLEVKSG